MKNLFGTAGALEDGHLLGVVDSISIPEEAIMIEGEPYMLDGADEWAALNPGDVVEYEVSGARGADQVSIHEKVQDSSLTIHQEASDPPGDPAAPTPNKMLEVSANGT